MFDKILSSFGEIPSTAIEWHAIRAQGAGGQNVNKVSSAIHLKFHIEKSGLSDEIQQKLMNLNDYRVVGNAVIVIKAQRFRTQEQNLEDALSRLAEIISNASKVTPPRIPTKPSYSSKQRRLASKARQGTIKSLRRVDLRDF